MKTAFRVVGFCLFIATMLFFAVRTFAQTPSQPPLPATAPLNKVFVLGSYKGTAWRITADRFGTGSSDSLCCSTPGTPAITFTDNIPSAFHIDSMRVTDRYGVVYARNTGTNILDLVMKITYSQPYSYAAVPCFKTNANWSVFEYVTDAANDQCTLYVSKVPIGYPFVLYYHIQGR